MLIRGSLVLAPLAAAAAFLAGCAGTPAPQAEPPRTFTETVLRCEESQPTGSKLRQKRCFTAEEIAMMEAERRMGSGSGAGTRTPGPR